MTVAEDLDYFADKYGEPSQFIPAPGDVLDRLRPSVPEVMLDYWQQFGFSVYLNGYMQIVNPETYAAALEEWLKGTKLEGTDTYYVIQRDAFGHLVIWGQKTGRNFVISPLSDGILMNRRNNEKAIAKGDINRWAEGCFHEIRYDAEDFDGGFFNEGIKRLGKLGSDQIFGLVPAIPLGGELKSENLQIFSAPEHLAMLANLSERPVLGIGDLAERAFGPGAAESLKKQLGD